MGALVTENSVVVAAILSKCLSSANLRLGPGRINVVNEPEIFVLIGEEGFRQLVAAFYRQVPADDILGPMYPADDLAGAEQRLRDFLVGRFGGPSRYLEQRGPPRLRVAHA